MVSRTRKELTLEEKIKVIAYVDEKHSQRDTAAQFGISKGAVGNIQQRKQEYLEQYENINMPNNRMRNLKKTEDDEVNHLTWIWFQKARSQNIPISGPILQEAAKEFGSKLGRTNFQASNGWLENFRKRYLIDFKNLHGEAESADPVSASQYISKLPDICRGYRSEDIFNADETALFYKALPKKSLVERYKQCKGSKYSKERLMVLLTTSLTGEKLKPFVIGKSAKPRCFKNINVNQLPVIYNSNKKAWMTTKLFKEWLEKLNKRFKDQNRKILLFLDNAEAHCSPQLSNIQIKFLPANTTSLIQL